MADALARPDHPETLGDDWLVIIDPQVVFADPQASPWGSSMWAGAVGHIATLAAASTPSRTIITRFVADPGLGGSWGPYYEEWPFALVPDGDPLYAVVRNWPALPSTSSRRARSASGRCCATSSATVPG